MSEETIHDFHQLATQIVNWGAERGLHNNPSLQGQLTKLTEELGEIAAGVARNHHERIIDGVGDLLVVLLQFGAIHDKILGMNRSWSMHQTYLEMCLNTAWASIKDRQGRTENGVFIKEGEQ